MTESSNIRPRVSVVMPARNAAKTILAAVASIQIQDEPAHEIVIVDHASEDDTFTIVKDFAKLDPRIRVLRCDGTFVEAANLAWTSAGGDLIARMDADDIAAPSKIRDQVDFLLQHPHLSACAAQVRIRKRLPDGRIDLPDSGYSHYEAWINSVITPDEIESQRFVDSPLPNPTVMIWRETLAELGGYADPPWAEDYDLWLRMIERGHRLGKVPKILLDWHDGETRATRSQDRYQLSRFQIAKAHYLSRIREAQTDGVVICGAGPTGKEMAGLLRERNITVNAFIEVNERQIGNRIADSPVFDTSHLEQFKDRAILLGSVGQRGAREKLRSLARENGYVEGRDFYCVA